MPDRLFGMVLEFQVAKMSMGVQAPEIGLAHLVQQLLGSREISSVLAVIVFGNRVRERVVGVFSWQDLPRIALGGREL